MSASALAAFVLTAALAFAGAGAAHADATVNPLTAAPIQVTTKQGQAVTIQLLGSGPVGDQLSYSILGGFGTVSTAHGKVAMESALFPTRAVYTPAAGFSGTDTFTYRVSDSAFDSLPATVTVTVTPAAADNHAPVATPASLTVENPGQGDLNPSGTDVDGDALTFSLATQPSHGTVAAFPNSGGVTFEYTPTVGYTGPDSFTFVANDGVLTSAAATVSITVIPQRANNPPTSVPPPTVVTAQDTPVAIVLSATDLDGDQIFFEQYGDALHGTVTGTDDGHLIYTPTLGYSGPDSFHYDVTDHRSTSDTYTVNISVTPAPVVNHVPTVVPFSVVTHVEPVAVTLIGSDPDGDPLSYTTSGGPIHGVLSGTGANLTYTPNAGFTGSDSFTYTASDGTNVSTPAAVQIQVLGAIGFVTPTLDVSVSWDLKKAAAKITSPAIATTGPDRLLVAFVSIDGPASATRKVSSVTGGGLVWSLVKRVNSTWGSVEAWQAHATTRLAAATVTAKFAKRGYDGSITVAAFANSASAVGSSAASAGKSGAPQATVTAGAGGSLIWAAGHDWTHAVTPVPLAGQEIVHSFLDKRVDDSFWTERTSQGYAGVPVTIGVSSPTVDRWQLVAVEIPATGVPTFSTFPTSTPTFPTSTN